MHAETQPRQWSAAPNGNDTCGFHFNWGIAHAHVPDRDHRDHQTPVPQPAPGVGGGAAGSGLLPALHLK